MDNFKISLRAARVNSNMTVIEASEKLRLSERTLRNYENNRTMPGADTLVGMAELYNIPIGNLKVHHEVKK